MVIYLSELNKRDKRFADEYIISLNAKDAALKAGFAKSTAESRAAEWVDPNSKSAKLGVLEYIRKKLEEIDLNKTMTAKEALQRLSNIGRREEKEFIVVTVKEKRSYYDENGKRATEEKEIPKIVEIPAKLSDTNKALELIGKYHSLFTDRVDMTSDLTIIFEDDYGEEES